MSSTELIKESETRVKLIVTIPPDELTPFLKSAAGEISKEAKIPGFRPGHAPYDEVVKKTGEMAVLEKALDQIIRKTFVKAVLEHKLETISPPEVNVMKLVPGSEVVYEATVSLVPHVKRLADWKTVKIKKNPIIVTDKEIDQALKDLTDMRRKEIRAAAGETIGKTDKVVVDLEMNREGVPIEGGQSKGSFVFMDHESYLPGLQEALLRMKEGEKKTFTILFPSEHFQKHLAGKEVEVTADIKEVFHLERPAIDEELANSLGFDTLDALRGKLNENIEAEKEREEEVRFERELLERLAEKSEFEETPKNLIENETQKMLRELQYHIASQGLSFDDYLASIKKTIEELETGFEPQAKSRLKIALLLKHIAKEEQISASEEELSKLVSEQAKGVKDRETLNRLHSPEYREYQGNILRNQAVIDLLKKTAMNE